MSGEREVWYRYEDARYAAPVDEFDRPIGSGELKVHLRQYEVIRHTPKGVWLRGARSGPWDFRDGRFVLKDARKRFACPTIDEAKQSFIARKQRQARIHRARVNQAEEAIRLVLKDAAW